MNRNKKKHLIGNWSPLRIQISRVIEQYPYKHGRRQPHINTGEKFREALLATQLGTSISTIGFMSNALAEGAIIPTDEEFAAADAANIDLPLNPKQAPVLWQPANTPITVPVAEISRLDMKKDIDQLIVNQGKPKVAPVLKEADNILEKIQQASPPPPPTTPPTPTPLVLPPFMTPIEAKNTGDKPEKVEQIKKSEEPKDKMLVGGELFGNMQKIKLTMGTIFWYFWCVNVYGFEGTVDDFLNWAVTDAISARGLSLDVRETQIPIPQGGENVKRE